MPLVTQLERLPGGDMRVLFDDESNAYAMKTGSGLWLISAEGDDPGPSEPGETPDSFVATNCNGESYTMNKAMLQRARIVYDVGESLGVGRQGIVIAFMTAFVESKFYMYANSTVPASLNYPHDAVGSDNDSLGIFQQRPSIPWGTVAQLMDVTYNAKAFYGGPSGPNKGNPPGLLDIPGWESMGYGAAAQAVQGSAFPDRYDCWRAAADGLYEALGGTGGGGEGGGFTAPFSFTNDVTSEYGPRSGVGVGTFHEGIDFGRGAALSGADIKCAADGTVLTNGWHTNFGNLIIVHHGTHSGKDLATLYAHRLNPAGPPVGEAVNAGTVIGQIGNTGASQGAHLHHETHVMSVGGSIVWNTNNDGNPRTAINPRAFYEQYG